MVLNQNEYTMTSLGFNYQKPPLFLPNQTRPPSFLINKIDSLLLSHPKKPSLHPSTSSSSISVAFFFLFCVSGGTRRRRRRLFLPLNPTETRFPSFFHAFTFLFRPLQFPAGQRLYRGTRRRRTARIRRS